MGKIRVLFDGYWWRTGPLANRAVQREFILAWAREFPEDDIALALRRGNSALPELPDAAVVKTRLWPHGVSNILELGRLGRDFQADIVISHNYAPFAGPSLAFIHDAMFVDHPEWFTRSERLYFSLMLPSLARADIVATSTRTEAERIERLRPKLAPVLATGLGVSEGLAEAVPTRPLGLEDVESFALSVGRLNVRKNLAAVIRGALTSERITTTSPLLVVGSAEYSGRADNLPSELRDQVGSGRVRFLGRVDDAGLAWLYANAALVISLSLDEGFGLPPIEARHFSAPLLVSDIRVHRETVDGYAHFVDPIATGVVLGSEIDAAWRNRRASTTVGYSWTQAVQTLRTAAIALLS